jgi:glucose dehydrogenase
VATLDARLWALSASTGQPVSGFGDGAGPVGSVTVADNNAGYSLTMAPLFIPRAAIPGRAGAKDLVVVGIAGGEYETRGFVTAYDALTGEIVWRFFTIPSPDEFGGDTWPSHRGRFADPYLRGGGAVWMTPAYDSAAGRLYIAVGNPSPNLDGTHRAGDNLFMSAQVRIINPSTGAVVMAWQLDSLTNASWDETAPTYNYGEITFEGDPLDCDEVSERWDPLTGKGCAGVTIPARAARPSASRSTPTLPSRKYSCRA